MDLIYLAVLALLFNLFEINKKEGHKSLLNKIIFIDRSRLKMILHGIVETKYFASPVNQGYKSEFKGSLQIIHC
jgi:hypothetical protein